jgi:hypothetical protein
MMEAEMGRPSATRAMNEVIMSNSRNGLKNQINQEQNTANSPCGCHRIEKAPSIPAIVKQCVRRIFPG